MNFILTYLAHQETINVLNCHAAVIASDHKYGSPKFYQQFANFVKLFMNSGYDQRYLEGERTAVTDAYWAFIKCCKHQVTRG